jgi:hypothetical protein
MHPLANLDECAATSHPRAAAWTSTAHSADIAIGLARFQMTDEHGFQLLLGSGLPQRHVGCNFLPRITSVTGHVWLARFWSAIDDQSPQQLLANRTHSALEHSVCQHFLQPSFPELW